MCILVVMGQAAEKIVPDGRVKIDLDKAIDLRMKGVPVSDIAKLFKVTETQVYRRLKRYKTDPGNISEFRKSKANRMEFIQAEILHSITPECIKKTPFVQRVTSFGILEDKIRLLRGESTQNLSLISNLGSMKQDRDEIMQKLNTLATSAETVTTGTQDIVGQNDEAEIENYPENSVEESSI